MFSFMVLALSELLCLGIGSLLACEWQLLCNYPLAFRNSSSFFHFLIPLVLRTTPGPARPCALKYHPLTEMIYALFLVLESQLLHI